MLRHHLRVGLLAAVALLTPAGLVSPGMVAAQDATPAAGVAVQQIAVVVPASRTNQGWDQQAADAVDAVAKEESIQGVVAENGGYEDITPVLKDLAAGGASLIICHASGYQTVCPEFAAVRWCPVAVIENPTAIRRSGCRHRDPGAGSCLPGWRPGRPRPPRPAPSAWSSPASRRPGTT